MTPKSKPSFEDQWVTFSYGGSIASTPMPSTVMSPHSVPKVLAGEGLMSTIDSAGYQTLSVVGNPLPAQDLATLTAQVIDGLTTTAEGKKIHPTVAALQAQVVTLHNDVANLTTLVSSLQSKLEAMTNQLAKFKDAYNTHAHTTTLNVNGMYVPVNFSTPTFMA